MRHEHLVVTVESGTKDRIDDDLEPGESLEAWVADAVERKLEAKEADAAGRGDAGGRNAGRSDAESRRRDSRPDRRDRDDDGRFGGRSEGGQFGDGADDGKYGDDGYDEGFEFVDDCSI